MYVKLFGSILDSSIWEEDHATVRLWIALLAMADEYGIVQASRSGLARRAHLTRDECDSGIRVLEGPDPDSRDGTDGRRIEKVAGGWLLLNYERYREIRSRKQVADAVRQRRHRQKSDTSPRSVTRHDVTAYAEAEAEAVSAQRQRTTADAVVTRPVAVGQLVEALTTEGQAAYEYLVGRWNPNQQAFDAELEAIVSGMRGIQPAPSWEAVSLALVDLKTNNGKPTPNALRAFARKAAEFLAHPNGNAGGVDPLAGVSYADDPEVEKQLRWLEKASEDTR